MKSTIRALLVATAFAGCEDGPDQIFNVNQGDPPKQNGHLPERAWTEPGRQDFGARSTGDEVGRARFCSESELTALIQRMVEEPIIPDVSVGGVPLWGPDGGPLHADELIGRPEDGKFCDPTGIYLDAFTWGPTDDVIVFFNQDTRLVEGVIAYQQYLGGLVGEFTKPDGSKESVDIRTRERIKIGRRELNQYASRDTQGARPGSWVNHANVNNLYRMVRETFFGASPFPASFDCVAAQICDIIYTAPDESNPQDTFIIFQDSGVQMRIRPEGQVLFVYLQPVRVAPFETAATIKTGDAMGVAPAFTSVAQPSCRLSLTERISYADFKSRCIPSGDTRTLTRANYGVHTARDGVTAEFNGMELAFLRKTSTSSVFKDGERPKDTDELYGINFFRTLNAPVDEFVPSALAAAYKQRLEARIRGAVRTASTSGHPFLSWTLDVPASIGSAPTRIGPINYTNAAMAEESWLPTVLAGVQRRYYALSAADRALVDPRVLEPTFLIEPFVDAVLDAFSHGKASEPRAFKAFRTTDDRRWSIGYANFFVGTTPYRMVVQYSLNFGAVTAVFVERGESEIDQVLAGVNQFTNRLQMQNEPYLTLRQIKELADGAFSLNGEGIRVIRFDRRLETLDVELRIPRIDQAGRRTVESVFLTVSGDPIEDQSGYLRQIRGERYEYVPANLVRLYGKETSMAFYVEADGQIGRVAQNTFKGSVTLCPGLDLRFGDDIRSRLEAWRRGAGDGAHRECEVVFNYSENGNVLNEVTSLKQRVAFTVIDGRAVTAAIWR